MTTPWLVKIISYQYFKNEFFLSLENSLKASIGYVTWMKCTLLMRHTVFWIRTIFWKDPTNLLTNPLIIIQFIHTSFSSNQVLEETRRRAVGLKQSQLLIFHASVYIFVMCFVPNGEIIILETHPIQEELHGNGNGLLVVSKSVDEIFAWIFKRASRTSVAVSCTPFLYHAVPCK